MYANGIEKIAFSTKSRIISLEKSFCGKYLAVLFQDSIQIYSLIQNNLPKLAEYIRDESSIKSKNFNHWIQWISNNSLVIGTQTGHLIFININQNSPDLIESVKSIDIVGKTITAHSSAFGALIISTPGPFLHFISPDSEILSSVSFESTSTPIPQIIRHINVTETYCLFVFSDGSVGHSKLKEQEIIDRKNVSIDSFPFISEISTAVCSNNKKYIIFLTYNGSLIRMNAETSEVTYIAENCSLFQITHDSFHVVALTADGRLKIWSNHTDHLTEAKVTFDAEKASEEEKNLYRLSFISSEIDLYSYRLFCATSQSAYVVTFSVVNFSKPSLMFLTQNYVIIPPTKVTITAPIDMTQSGYPLKYASYSPASKCVAVAGRKYFSFHLSATNEWKMIKDDNIVCRALWSNDMNCFVSVVYDFEKSQYFVLLLSSDNFALIESVPVEGNFVDYDELGNYFLIGTSTSVSIYQFIPAKKAIKTFQYKNVPSYEKVLLLHNFHDVVYLNHEKQLVDLQSNEILIEGVSSVLLCKESDLFLVVAHEHQFAYYYPERELIRLDVKNPGIIVHGLSLYSIPPVYDLDKFELDASEFLPAVIFHFIEKTTFMFNIIKEFSSTPKISIDVSRALNLAIINNKLDKFLILLDMFGEGKITFLLVALFNVDQKFVGIIKDLLPPLSELVKKFPDLADQLKRVYSS